MIDILNLALPYFGPDLHRHRVWQVQGSAGRGFGMNELLSALCFDARVAVWNHAENAVRGTQQRAIFDRHHRRNHVPFVLAMSA